MIPILLYTHSEYSFIWKATIPLLERYAKDFQIIWCCDSPLDFKFPSHWKMYMYDPLLTWSYRIKGCLEMIESDYLIYLQEDCLLIDSLSQEKIQYCLHFMKAKKCEFLMSYLTNQLGGDIPTKYENYNFSKIFSHYMQPAIWKKSLLVDLTHLNKKLSENEDSECFTLTSQRNCYGIYNTKFLKDLTTRSFFFPHMHAIYQGKWTFEKYPCLKALVESYGVDTTRDTDKTWLIEYQ